MWTRLELKTRAKAVLKTSYWKAFLVSLIIAIIGGNTSGTGGFNWNFGGNKSQVFSNTFGNANGGMFPLFAGIFLIIVVAVLLFAIAFRVLLGYPLEVGARRYFIRSAQNDVSLNHLGYVFDRSKYINVIKSMLWRTFLNFLWFLLFIIPGIVKSYAYIMVPYILADNPNIGYKRALELSVKMTDGHKLDMWVLDLSFIGWNLLGILALLVGGLFVMPYYNATQAELYMVLRQNALEYSFCTPEDLMLSSAL